MTLHLPCAILKRGPFGYVCQAESTLTEEQEKNRIETAEVLKPYQKEPRNLIPILQAVQGKIGYLPREAMIEVAVYLCISPADVYGVVTFYDQFRLTPPGKHPIKVCLGTACHMKGGNLLLESWERELKVKQGETTPDREFSLERVACVGCCAMAPVAVVDGMVRGKVTPTKVSGLLLGLKMGKQQQTTDAKIEAKDDNSAATADGFSKDQR